MLPDQIDRQQRAGLLQQFGVDPQNNMGSLGGQQGGYDQRR